MTTEQATRMRAYARLIIQGGVNLQDGQALNVVAELGHRDFVRVLMAEAYDLGARLVEVRWFDPMSTRTRYQHIRHEFLDYVPEYEASWRKEVLETGWANVRLTGDEYLEALEDVDPALIARERAARMGRLKFFQEAVMNNRIAWCVAAVPTIPWARKVFPGMDAGLAADRLWDLVLRTSRADQPDPLQAWALHDAALKKVAASMESRQVREVRYLDERPGPDGKPSTDLTVGLTDKPVWACGSSQNGQGLRFFPNIPTEEVFSTPHNARTRGWVRTSRPAFPFEREVSNASFRFHDGEVVEWKAEKGKEVLDQLFQLKGARRLGELSLVDVRSPVHQAGVTFHEVLFDENAACHIAFGQAYPMGLRGGNAMSRNELNSLGVNESDIHEDFMIGTPSMKAIGTCENGEEVLIMENGKFVEA